MVGLKIEDWKTLLKIIRPINAVKIIGFAQQCNHSLTTANFTYIFLVTENVFLLFSGENGTNENPHLSHTVVVAHTIKIKRAKFRACAHVVNGSDPTHLLKFVLINGFHHVCLAPYINCVLQK